MESVFNRLLIAIKNKIFTDLPDSPEEPGIRYINQDLGQLDFYVQRPPVSWPCVLIDFTDTTYEQKQFKAQWGQMNITLRMGFDQWSDSSNLAPQEVEEKALRYFELENKLYKALQDWDADGLLMVKMRRIGALSEQREDKYRVRRLSFRAMYEDRAAQG